MLTLLSRVASDLVLGRAVQHLTGADAGSASSHLAILWHVVSSGLVPIGLAAASLTLAFVSTPRARWRVADARSSRAPGLAYSRDGRPGGLRSGGEGEDHPSTVRAVDRLYRVTFADEPGFRLWTERVIEFTSALNDVVPELREMRPVIFVQLRPSRGAAIHAYVSAGARGLAAHISGGVTVEPTPIAVSGLPPGLTLLFGEGVDASEYERRHAQPR